mmetsp:Transcript_2859/g.5985  ORF Transcript_2859/g.5985 Transcript_2859/m.5985 type:complete len:175 (-) Transcript_2859:312-836(-)
MYPSNPSDYGWDPMRVSSVLSLLLLLHYLGLFRKQLGNLNRCRGLFRFLVGSTSFETRKAKSDATAFFVDKASSGGVLPRKTQIGKGDLEDLHRFEPNRRRFVRHDKCRRGLIWEAVHSICFVCYCCHRVAVIFVVWGIRIVLAVFLNIAALINNILVFSDMHFLRIVTVGGAG